MADGRDLALLAAVADGLPVCPRPYARLGLNLAMTESEVLARLRALRRQGLIKRFGVIVRHRALGYRANAMVVWDLPEPLVREVGRQIAAFPFVTLCYLRPRLPAWPYNLYCMIHGQSRATVLGQLARLEAELALGGFDRQVLFSRRCFKQRGAAYPHPAHPAPA